MIYRLPVALMAGAATGIALTAIVVVIGLTAVQHKVVEDCRPSPTSHEIAVVARP